METIGQEKFITNSSVPTAEESKNNGTDEIVIKYYLNLCQAILYFIMSVILFPLFYFFAIDIQYKHIAIVDREKKVLIIGSKGVAGCCTCCVTYKTEFDLNGIKSVSFRLEERGSDIMFSDNKSYLICCDIYSTRGQKVNLFRYIKYTKEKYNEFVSFFKQFTEVIEEGVQGKHIGDIPGENEITEIKEITPKDEENNIESKPSFNESAPLPLMP